MEQLCGLFAVRRCGLTRHAWYAATRRQGKVGCQAGVVLAEVKRLRREVPGLGTAKQHDRMQSFLAEHHIKLGRDKLHSLLKANKLLLTKKQIFVRTTYSGHGLKMYPHLVKDLKPTVANQLWVGDLSYVRAGMGFAYVSVVINAYSRKIVGWSVHKTLEATGPIAALDMALCERGLTDKPLIHHSDRDGPPLRRTILFKGIRGPAVASPHRY